MKGKNKSKGKVLKPTVKQVRTQFSRTSRSTDRFPLEKPHSEPKVGLGKSKGNWPLKREILFRPERNKYVKKIEREEGCVFCKAASGPVKFDTLKLFESELSMIVMNKYPYNNGHLLILPKRHVGDLLLLSEEEFSDLHKTLKIAVEVIKHKAGYEPQGINLGMNLGRASGGGIPDHLHYHLVPRWTGDSNFFSLIAEAKVIAETLEQTFQILKPLFETQRRGAR